MIQQPVITPVRAASFASAGGIISSPASSAAASARSRREALTPQRPLIYIVDDDEAVLTALRILVRSLGWDSRIFSAAGDVLTGALPDTNACLLIDLNMPGMNGAELLETLRARGSTLPVIGITAEKNSPLMARMRKAGVRDFLFKPFDDEALRSAVAVALG